MIEVLSAIPVYKGDELKRKQPNKEKAERVTIRMKAQPTREQMEGFVRTHCQKVRQRGDELTYLCPAHKETNPSAALNLRKAAWNCNGCGAKGNFWDLVMTVWRCSFAEATEYILCVKSYASRARQPKAHAARSRPNDAIRVLPVEGLGQCRFHPSLVLPDKQIIRAYRYCDEEQKEQFVKFRYAPKDFRIAHRDGSGMYVPGLGDAKDILYNLSKLRDAKQVVLTECEKDADTGEQLGLTTTCNPHGASESIAAYASAFRDIDVVIIPHNDDAGEKRVLRDAAILHGVARSLKIARVPYGKDLTDWIQKGGTRKDLERFIAEVPEWKPSEPPALAAQVTIPEGEIIAALEQFLCKYLVLPERAALPLACWVAATHFYREFEIFPYLHVTSPVKQCGKTRLGKLLCRVALNPVLVSGVPTEASLYRMVDSGDYTIIMDELEALRNGKNDRSQDVRAILNSGYEKGASVPRFEPPKYNIRWFSTYCPKVLIGIGSVPDTVRDRSLEISMRRKKVGEAVSGFPARRVEKESEPPRKQLQHFAQTHKVEIASVYENLPEMSELADRDEEIWQPLFAVCAVFAPGRLTELKKAALVLSGSKAAADVDDSLELRLLADIAELLKDCGEHVSSAELVSRLKELPESPWAEHGHELTQNRLARMLRRFSVSSRKVRARKKPLQGYLKAELEEAACLYTGTKSGTSETSQ